MFFTRMCRSVRKLFDKLEAKEVSAEAKPMDVSADQFDDCRQSVSETPLEDQPLDEALDDMCRDSDDCCRSGASDVSVVSPKIVSQVATIGATEGHQWQRKPFKQSKWEHNHQRPTGSHGGAGFKNRFSDANRLLEKWGESVGIFDEMSGAQKRLIRLYELNNFFVLRLSSLNCSDCLILCSLINSRYPRFYTSTVNYYQRWRMRYNIFVASDSLICRTDQDSDQWVANRRICSSDPLSCVPSEQLAVHIGEMHLYFDVVPKFCQPVYVNSSFYGNQSAINEMPGVAISAAVMTRVSRVVNSMRYSKDIFQLKFPLNEEIFHRKNHMFDKFIERQTEFIDETIKVYRKTGHKNRKCGNWSQRQTKHRDYFAYDYDIKHFEADTDNTAIDNTGCSVGYKSSSTRPDLRGCGETQ